MKRIAGERYEPEWRNGFRPGRCFGRQGSDHSQIRQRGASAGAGSRSAAPLAQGAQPAGDFPEFPDDAGRVRLGRRGLRILLCRLHLSGAGAAGNQHQFHRAQRRGLGRDRLQPGAQRHRLRRAYLPLYDRDLSQGQRIAEGRRIRDQGRRLHEGNHGAAEIRQVDPLFHLLPRGLDGAPDVSPSRRRSRARRRGAERHARRRQPASRYL